MDDVVALVRRWAVDWLEAADPAACEDLLSHDYSLAIGGIVLGGPDGGGRRGYVDATVAGLLRPYPGATIVVHDLIATDDRAAVLMTWRGRTPEGRRATWRVVATFRAEDGRLAESHCEEDYLGRRRQLKSGEPDPVPPAAGAPWDVRPVPRDPAAEAVVRGWLRTGDLSGVTLDDARGPAVDASRPAGDASPGADRHAVDTSPDGPGPAADPRLDDVRPDVLDCFAAGPRVAFHAHLRGRLRGTSLDVVLPVAGLVTVAGGAVVDGHVVRDRAGLRATLVTHAKESA